MRSQLQPADLLCQVLVKHCRLHIRINLVNRVRVYRTFSHHILVSSLQILPHLIYITGPLPSHPPHNTNSRLTHQTSTPRHHLTIWTVRRGGEMATGTLIQLTIVVREANQFHYKGDKRGNNKKCGKTLSDNWLFRSSVNKPKNEKIYYCNVINW